MTHTIEVARRSLACRVPSTATARAYDPAMKSRAAIRPHWMRLSRPAPAPMPIATAADPAATAGGVQRGRVAALRVEGRLVSGPVGVGVVVLMRWPPSTPCGAR
ncbi:hypothetical protein SALBM135S_06621 [Streptomyces alboniger]